MKKRLFLPLLFVALGVFSFAPRSQNTQSVQAAGDATQTLTAQNLIKEVWNNNQADVNKGLFTFGVSHGCVSDSKVQPMTKVNTGGGGNMSGQNCSIEWDGALIRSTLKDRVILRFTAHARITISTFTTTNPGGDWADNGDLCHYVAPVTYSFAKPTYVGAAKSVTKNTFAVEDFSASYSLRPGETYFWEWGSDCYDQNGNPVARNLYFAGRNLSFTVSADDASTSELTSLNLNLLDVVKKPAIENGGKFIETGLVNYGMTFGKILSGEFETPVIDGENYIVDEIMPNVWWKLYAANNKGFAFTFTAKERVNISINVKAFGGWVEHMKIYYVVARGTNQRVVYTCEGVSPLTPECFSSAPVELMTGETAYFFVTSYGNADNTGSCRNMQFPDNTGNDVTFKVEEVKQTYNAFALTNDWLNFRATHPDFCVLNTEDSATLDSYIARFNNLTNEEKALVGRVHDSGNYTITDSVNYFATLNQQSNVASFATSNLTAIFVLILVVAFGVTALFIYKKRNSAK